MLTLGMMIRSQHINTSHPGFRCQKCDLAFASADLLGAHYQESPVHPRCPECQLSFEDNLALIKVEFSVFLVLTA
jgi:hypothetical protein